MRYASYALVALGIIVILVAVINHLLSHGFLTFANADKIVGGVGLVVAIIGVVLMFVGGRKAASN